MLNVNRAPQLDFMANLHIDHDTVVHLPLQAVDADGDPLRLALVGLPAFGEFVDYGDGTGQLTFKPGRDDRGNYTLSLSAFDNGDGNGPGAILSATQSFVLSVDATNVPPHLAPIGNQVALVGQALQFTIQAGDGDQEALAFSAVGLPGNASIAAGPAYGQAVISWTPTALDVGNYTVLVRVADGGNGDPARSLADQRTFTLAVRTSNQAPAWLSSATQTAPASQTLALQLRALDADGDPLTYSAANLPVGATLDALAGVLTWTPLLVQVGKYEHIVLTASDGNLATSQTMSITVTPVNEAPRFVPLPAQSGREGTLLQFTLAAADANQDPLTYSATSALPAGVLLEASTGRLQWTPDYQQAGDYALAFTVTDAGGLTDSLAAQLHIDNVDRPPTLLVDNHGLLVGQPFSLQLTGADADLATTLSYSASGLPAGATLDAGSGRLLWTPGPSQTGDFPVQFAVSDGELTITRPSLLRVTLAAVPPQVLIELTPSFPGVPGSPVLVHAAASSVAPISGLTLTVDGQPLVLDVHGRATYVPATPGRFAIVATASDGDGRVGTASSVLKVRDPNDQLAPLLSLANLAAGSTLTSVLDLRGSVSDSNLDFWTLELAPLGSERFTTLAGGDSSVSGVLYALDPASLANGVYRLRLTASDISGRTTTTETVFDANTASKPGSYQQADVDLSANLGGTVVHLVRSYDSLQHDVAGTFGLGWRLANRDSDIQTSVVPTGEESRGIYNPFQQGTRVYLTLPDGRRVGYTFTPEKHTLSGVSYYTPAYQADVGVDYRLDSAGAVLIRGPKGFYDAQTGQAYDPASGQFDGPEYTLSAPDGTVYQLSAAKGVEQQVLPGGGRLIFTDDGITSSTGEAVHFVRDASGRVSEIIGPDGRRVVYAYDALGKLTSFHDTSTQESSRYGYAGNDAPRLILATSPSTQTGKAIEYGANVLISPVLADLGGPGQFSNTPFHGTLTAGASDLLSFNLRPLEIQSTRQGTVLLGVELRADVGSALQPALPTIAGLTPLLQRIGNGSAFALFSVSDAGLALLRIAGIDAGSAGAYTLQLFVAGDANEDGKVDGLDAALVAQALGSSSGQVTYVAAVDANRDGTIDPNDAQLLGSNFGFVAIGPPVAHSSEALTHIDLPTSIDLTTLASDAAGDPLFFRIVGAQNGMATLAPGGRSVSFLPDVGFAGQGSFQFLADDGYGTSAVATVVVTVSNAPLINLDFQERAPRLQLGVIGSWDAIWDVSVGDFVPTGPAPVVTPVDFQFNVFGDFADQQGVFLPSSYLTFQSTDLTVASVSSSGLLHAVNNGSTALVVASHGVQAATAVTVGIPESLLGQYLYALGLNAYPGAVTLSSKDGSRQMQVFAEADTTLSMDLTAAAAGTRYFLNHPGVVTVSADGLITAVAEGNATLTVINGAAESLLPVRVVAPGPTGPAVLGSAGGVVTAVDGSYVAVPPGDLAAETTVSLTSATLAELPQAVPDGFKFAAAFNLDVGDKALAVPLQLHVKVDPSIPVGATVYFYQAGEYLNDDGTTRPIWWQVDSGEVGSDGMAHTHSRPFPGIKDKSQYLIAYPTVDLGRLQLEAALIQQLVLTVSLASAGGTLVGTLGAVSAAGIMASLAVPSAPQPLPFAIQVVPQDGLPITTVSDFQINPNQVSNYATTITPPPSLPPTAPHITSVSVDLSKTDPATGELLHELVLTGSHFTDSGQNPDELSVSFSMPGPFNSKRTTTVSPSSGSTATELHVLVPASVVLGLAQIRVTRIDAQQSYQNGVVVYNFHPVDSNEATINSEGTYVFVALPEGKYTPAGVQGDLAVLNGNPILGELGDLIARIPLDSAEDNPFPRDVAITPDNTRAYVTLRGSGRVAVVDTVALQQINTNSAPPPASNKPISGSLHVDPDLFGREVSRATAIRATIDIANLASWTLSLLAMNDGSSMQLATGSGTVNSGILTTFDPKNYATGNYRLELVATRKDGLSFVDSSVYIYSNQFPSDSIRLPFGAQPYGIAIDPAGKYAYVAAQSPYLIMGVASSYLFQIDIDPASVNYNRVVQNIRVGGEVSLSGVDQGNQQSFASASKAPSGLRKVAVSADGLHVYVTAPNENTDPNGGHSWTKLAGNLVDIDLSKLQAGDPAAIKYIPGSRETYGVAVTPGRQDVGFTNAEADALGVFVTNFAASQKRTIPLDLDKLATALNPQLAVHNASGIVFTPDGSYAFVAARADQVNKVFGGEFNGFSFNGGGVSGYLDQSANPLYEAGNVAIIKDPLTDHPQVVAATRPTPHGFPVDLALSADGRYLYVSYQGLPTSAGSGGVMVFDARAMLQLVQLQLAKDPSGKDMRKYAIDDLPLINGNRAANAEIDVRADYLLHTDTLDDGSTLTAFGIPAGSNRPPVLTGGFPGGIALQTRSYPLSVYDASGDNTPETVFQHGVLKVSFGIPSSGLAGVVKQIQLKAKPTGGGADVLLKTYNGQQLQVTDELLNLDVLLAGPAGSTPSLPSEGYYKIYLHLEFENGAAAQDVGFKPMIIQGDRADTAAPFVASDGMIRGSFAPQTYKLADYLNDGIVIYGGGGTDTLNLGVLPAQLTSIDGRSLSAFNNAWSSPPSQVIYRGTAFDYLCLDTGQEIYCQGIERLLFSDGTVKELQVHPSDPFYSLQWNLAVTDTPDAWRFTTGSSKILIVSVDNGLPNAPTGVDDLDPTRIDASHPGAVSSSGSDSHGHQSISIMSAIVNNALGVAGINWTSPVLVEDPYNAASSANFSVSDALAYAVAKGYDHVVFQGGIQGEGWLTSGGTPAQLQQLIAANANYALFAVAAGNGGIDIDITNPGNPVLSGGVARFAATNSNVIAVGALIANASDAFTTPVSSLTAAAGLQNATAVSRANYSNFGPTLTLMAPTDSPAVIGNGTVLGNWPGLTPASNGSLFFNGTSAANPNMAGYASLVWSVNPDLTGGELRQLLIDTASPLAARKTTGVFALTAAVPDATTTSISVSDSYTSAGPAFSPSIWVIRVGSEDMLVTSVTPGIGSSTYQVIRAYNGTTSAAHNNGLSVVRFAYSGATASVGTTPGTGQNLAYGYGLVDVGAAVRRAFALTSNPLLANFYLSNGTRNLAVADSGTVTAVSIESVALTMSDLDAAATNPAAALELWSSRLHEAAAIQISVSLADLPDGQLGEARIDAVGADGLPTAGTIVLDRNASGLGWFVDPTPLDHSEFSTTLADTAFRAAADSLAAGRYDLLTVLLHEEGHLLGFNPLTAGFAAQVGTVAGSQVFVGAGFTARLSLDGQHLASSSYADDLMNDILAPSVRRLPSARDVQIIDAIRSPIVAPSILEALFPEAVLRVSDALPVGYGQPSAAALLHAAPPVSPNVNNGFTITGAGGPLLGWTESGSVVTTVSTATLSENSTVNSGLSQTFVVPLGATSLEFTLAASDFRSNVAGNPPDAFEAALLDASGNSLVGTATGLSMTDAFLNVQSDGDIFFAPGVSVSGRSVSGQGGSLASPITVSVDLAGVAAGSAITLYLDLLGFGPYDSSLILDDVRFGLANGNHAPVAVDDQFVVSEDVPTLLDVLGNDSDAENSPLTVTVVAAPGHGTLTQTAGGNFLYTPAANYNGLDGFTYTVNDGLLDSRLASVSLSIAAVNDAPRGTSASIVTLEGTSAVLKASDFGFSDPDDTPANAFKAVIIDSLPSAGTLTLNGLALSAGAVVELAEINANALLFTPAAKAIGVGYAQLSFRVQDDGGTANAGVDTDPTARTLSFDVTAVNHAPLAVDDQFVVSEDVPTLLDVLGNDSDAENSPLTVTVVAAPGHGTLTQTVGGNFLYTPAANYNGLDGFTYTVNDGLLDSRLASVSLSIAAVNDAPRGTSASIVTLEGTSAVLKASDFGFSDPDDTPANAFKAVIIDSLPSAGTLTLNGLALSAGAVVELAEINANALLFTPAAKAIGVAYAQLSFRVQDDGGTANAGVDTDPTARTLSFDVTAVNQAPIAVADSARVDAGDSVLIDVLANDSDPENQALTLASVSQPAHGTAVVEDGQVRYTPAAGNFSTDDFHYVLADSAGASSRGDVRVTIEPRANHAPTLDPIADIRLKEGEILTVFATGHDVDKGDALTYSVDASLAAGARIDPLTGAISWRVSDGDEHYGFVVRVNDSGGASATRRFTVSVANVAPTLRVAGLPSTAAGEIYTLALSSSDPGDDRISNWRIDWGDGQVVDYAGNPRQLEHRYGAVAGPLEIRATVTDEDGSYVVEPLPLVVTRQPLQLASFAVDSNGVAGSASAGQQANGVDRLPSSSAPGIAPRDTVFSAPPGLATDDATAAAEVRLAVLPQIDFLPRPAGFRLPVGLGRGTRDEWRKSFVTNMAKKSDNPNKDLRVTPGPSRQLPVAPEEFLEDAPEGTPERLEEGTPERLPDRAQEANADGQDEATLAGMMLVLPLVPFEPVFFRSILAARPARKANPQPPTTGGRASG